MYDVLARLYGIFTNTSSMSNLHQQIISVFKEVHQGFHRICIAIRFMSSLNLTNLRNDIEIVNRSMYRRGSYLLYAFGNKRRPKIKAYHSLVQIKNVNVDRR